jgi:hypothetical protein
MTFPQKGVAVGLGTALAVVSAVLVAQLRPRDAGSDHGSNVVLPSSASAPAAPTATPTSVVDRPTRQAVRFGEPTHALTPAEAAAEHRRNVRARLLAEYLAARSGTPWAEAGSRRLEAFMSALRSGAPTFTVQTQSCRELACHAAFASDDPAAVPSISHFISQNLHLFSDCSIDYVTDPDSQGRELTADLFITCKRM